ncbi:TetR/AcrR family transcriptional regulator [Lactiplantibacillus mudanjiangensis]|uniref:TetR family transcriptional regulator [Lactobacillus curieae] n=1 Tax=Lactiplantibacillus mudanjiangensis TaxID=1296538 RepID=A0A660DZ81_9LACO|nr:TetR/AcrR family transcriptional regulator [Lactiplantibacillus mudanjiangensis]VDG19622.1 TetR family transcriptional regulator [Lactobacillus curieae] [Lactiplantibacillus mudanjiangensis]VDG25538.1 TetR family transcriptional regulator [Lactobacillus curieae] [Lactiplantibacillus mudanjiangensis]VDG28547.1 TetR family transcriptional regulator [Lactobacillus curieae] [Lactiplantibacillus mudanjiangensis]VDG31068.1 TetR family transcriptional regulator [Lactobacillus curieae] [Lactiplantib
MNSLTTGQKAEKARAIATAAQQQFEQKSFSQITMAAIAKQAGCSKGTLFNYYESKESLFMTLLLDGYCDYFEGIIKQVDGQTLDLTQFAALLLTETANLIDHHATLLRLNALRGPILEQGANLAQTIAHRQALYDVNERLAQAICTQIPTLTVAEVSQLYLVQSAIISGLMNLAALDEFQQRPLIEQNFEHFKINIKTDAVTSFKYYLLGRYPTLTL